MFRCFTTGESLVSDSHISWKASMFFVKLFLVPKVFAKFPKKPFAKIWSQTLAHRWLPPCAPKPTSFCRSFCRPLSRSGRTGGHAISSLSNAHQPRIGACCCHPKKPEKMNVNGERPGFEHWQTCSFSMSWRCWMDESLTERYSPVMALIWFVASDSSSRRDTTCGMVKLGTQALQLVLFYQLFDLSRISFNVIAIRIQKWRATSILITRPFSISRALDFRV